MNKIQKEDITLFADTFNLYECLRNKSFMVTGATGLIGSELVYGLIALNHRYDLNIHIDCLVRNTEKARLMFEEYEAVSYTHRCRRYSLCRSRWAPYN